MKPRHVFAARQKEPDRRAPRECPLGNSVPLRRRSKWRKSLPSIPIFRTIPLLKDVFTMTMMNVRRERFSCHIIVSPAQATRPTAASVPRLLACKRNLPAPKNIRLRRAGAGRGRVPYEMTDDWARRGDQRPVGRRRAQLLQSREMDARRRQFLPRR